MTRTGTTAAIYVRISRDSEGRGLGVERQEVECQALVERLGWNAGPVFADNDISAYSGKRRPGYEAMVEAIKAGHVGAIVAWHPDRLTRRAKDLEALIDLLEANEVAVATVAAGAYDLGSPSGRMAARIVGAVAQGESEHKAERLRSQRRQAAAAGDYHGGMRPYGFEADGVTHHPVEAPIVRQAVEAILAGGSITHAARLMGRSRGSVLRTLRSARVAGLRQHRGEVVGQASWEPIVDRATWERLLVVLSDPRRKNDRPARSYLLAGLVVATDERGEVVRRMTSRPTGDRRFYVTIEPKDRSVSADRLEQLVVDALLARFDSARVEADPADAIAETTAATVAALEDELAELAELRGRGEITIAEWMAARNGTEARLEVARAAIPTRTVPKATADLFGAPGELRRRWPELSFAQRRAVLNAAIAHIGVGSAVRGASFDPTRISIAWR